MRRLRGALLLSVPMLAGAGAPARAQARDEGPGEGRGVARTVVAMGGGVLVGGFMGYFISQVGTSDWTDLRPDQKATLRRRFTVSGAAAGAVTGLLLRPRVNHSAFTDRAQLVAPRAGRLLLTAAELRRSVGTSVLEAIELERPEWLQTRLKSEPAPLASLSATALVVYVGDERVGDVDRLRDVALPEVRELRFYDARDATRRWRTEHPYGAIEVVPVRPMDADVR